MHCVLGIHLKEATDAINKLVDESIGKNTAKSRLKIMVWYHIKNEEMHDKMNMRWFMEKGMVKDLLNWNWER